MSDLKNDTDITVPKSKLEPIAFRRVVWDMADTIVSEIVHAHELEPYKVSHAVMTPGTTVTRCEQRVDLTVRVADWLLEGHR